MVDIAGDIYFFRLCQSAALFWKEWIMNWSLFLGYALVAVTSKFLSVQRMTPGYKRAFAFMTLVSGAALGMYTPDDKATVVLAIGIIAIVYGSDLFAQYIGIVYDKIRIYQRVKDYAQTTEAGRKNSSRQYSRSGFDTRWD